MFLDLSVAFNIADHTALLCKPWSFFGVRGVTYNLFQSYLNNPYQNTRISKFKSSKIKVLCNASQGSCLRSLFILLYVNDLQ